MSERLAEPYVQRCLFCHREHKSLYWDDLEAEIMRCRERADTRDLGLVVDYKGGERIVRETGAEEVEGPAYYGV